MGKFFTDQERYEHCRRFRISGLTVAEYARRNGINRSTLRDWVNAYNHINGKFINVSNNQNNKDEIINTDDYRVNILDDIEIIKKSSHFTRFDHSVVVIEYKDIKVTTSLEQAEVLLGRLVNDKI